MPFWEYELFMKAINELVKEENKRNEEHSNNSQYNDIKKMANIKNIERMQNRVMKSTKLPDAKIPKL